MDEVSIGKAAGAVWKYLRETPEATLASLKKVVDAPADEVAAAVGWLAREGKIEFAQEKRRSVIRLRESETVRS